MSQSKSHRNLLHAEQALLVVIDMQEPFLRNIIDRERVLHNVQALVSGARALRIPVIATTQYAERLGGVVWEIQQLLDSQPVDKMTFSCYADFRFSSEVEKTLRKQVLLCGVESHICVSQTAHDLNAAGYQVHVAADAVSSRTELNWKLGLEKMRLGGIIPSSVETALYEMLREAGTPEFKEILKIIK